MDNDSIFSDDNLSNSFSNHDNNSIGLNNDHMAFFKQASILQNAQPKYKKKPQVIEDNGYESQFAPLSFDNPSAPVSSNSVGHKTGNKSGVAKLEIERALALKGNYSNFDEKNMTYNVVEENKLAHNNMVPFFRTKTGMGYSHDSLQSSKVNAVNQRKMELFSGSSKSVDYRPKTERRPLFNPIVGAEKWVYGQPNATNYFETRFIPGKERRNERPFQETRVTPGLAKGYNEISKEGFNDTFRALPKTVDELRTADKPKVSYGGVIVPGMKGQRRGIQSMVAHHRPPTFKEQDPRDFLKSLTYYRAPAIYGNVDESVPMTNRAERSEAWYGPVAFSKDEARPDSMQEQFRTPNKENFLSPTPRNTTGVDREKATSNTANSYHVKQTERVTTEVNGYIGHAKPGDYNKGRAFDMVTNIPELNERNASTNQTYVGHANQGQLNKNYLYDYQNAITSPNNRNQTENREYVGPAGNSQNNKAYLYDYQNAIGDPNNRNINTLNGYIGQANQGNLNKAYLYDYQNAIPSDNNRTQTENVAYIGQAGNREINKQYLYDYQNAIMDSTRRDETGAVSYVGVVGNNALNKTYAFDHFTNIGDSTKRDTYIDNTYIGGAGNGPLNKFYAFDYNNAINSPTKRDQIINNTYVGMAGTEYKKAQLFDYDNAINSPTKRDTYTNTTYIGSAGNSSLDKGYLFDYNNAIADPNRRAETELTNYITGPGTEYKKAQLFDYSNAINSLGNRAQTTQTSYIGSAGPSDWKKGQLFDYNNAIADPTKRDETINVSYLSPANHNSLNKSYAYDMKTNIPDMTKKDILTGTTYIGHAKNSQLNKPQAFDMLTNIPDITKRDASSINTHINGAGTAWKQTYAYDKINATPDFTRRNSTEVNTTIIGVHGVDMEKGAYQADYYNTQVKPTLRQLMENTTHLNPAVLHDGLKYRARGDVNEMLVDIAKEKLNVIRDEGAPTTCNYEIGPIYDYTMVELIEPIQINRDVYGAQPWGNPLQCVPTIYNRQPNDVASANVRLDPCILSGLDTNVFINNTQNKYVEY